MMEGEGRGRGKESGGLCESHLEFGKWGGEIGSGVVFSTPEQIWLFASTLGQGLLEYLVVLFLYIYSLLLRYTPCQLI